MTAPCGQPLWTHEREETQANHEKDIHWQNRLKSPPKWRETSEKEVRVKPSDAPFPSEPHFYLFVRLSAHKVSPLAPQWCQSSLIPPLRAQKSCCLVISSHRNESTHYVWLSSCSQEVTNSRFFSSLEPLHANSSYTKQQTPEFPGELEAPARKQELKAAALKCQVSWDIHSITLYKQVLFYLLTLL